MTENLEGIIPSSENGEEVIAQENFFIWNEALKTGNSATVAELYTETATFLPTLSGEFKQGKSAVEEYFKHFLEKIPTGEIIEEEVQTLGPDCYLHSGMYNFTLGLSDGQQIVEARFTFVWKQDDQGEWKIIHHHSSVKPRG